MRTQYILTRPYDNSAIRRRFSPPKKRPATTDQLGLCGIRHQVPDTVADKQIKIIQREYEGRLEHMEDK